MSDVLVIILGAIFVAAVYAIAFVLCRAAKAGDKALARFRREQLRIERGQREEK